MSRAVKSLSAEELAPLVREVYKPDGAKMQQGTFGTLHEFLEVHVEFIMRLRGMTARPTASLLVDDDTLVFEDLAPGTVACFAALVVAIIKKARNTKRSTVTGEQLDGGGCSGLSPCSVSLPTRRRRLPLCRRRLPPRHRPIRSSVEFCRCSQSWSL